MPDLIFKKELGWAAQVTVCFMVTSIVLIFSTLILGIDPLISVLISLGAGIIAGCVTEA